VNAKAPIDIKPPWLTKERFVAGAVSAMPVAGRLGLAIRLCFHSHAPWQLARGLPFQKAAARRGGRRRVGEELGGRDGYGSGLRMRGVVLTIGKP
jgi:hypothetical protein